MRQRHITQKNGNFFTVFDLISSKYSWLFINIKYIKIYLLHIEGYVIKGPCIMMMQIVSGTILRLSCHTYSKMLFMEVKN